MRAIFILAALLYSQDATTQRHDVRLGSVLPQFVGAPCSTKTDLIEGTCRIVVRKKPRIKK